MFDSLKIGFRRTKQQTDDILCTFQQAQDHASMLQKAGKDCRQEKCNKRQRGRASSVLSFITLKCRAVALSCSPVPCHGCRSFPPGRCSCGCGCGCGRCSTSLCLCSCCRSSCCRCSCCRSSCCRCSCCGSSCCKSSGRSSSCRSSCCRSSCCRSSGRSSCCRSSCCRSSCCRSSGRSSCCRSSCCRSGSRSSVSCSFSPRTGCSFCRCSCGSRTAHSLARGFCCCVHQRGGLEGGHAG